MVKTEKRVHPRMDLLAQIQIVRNGECHVMEMVNISRGGLFVLGAPADHPDLSMGKIVDLSICDPDLGDELSLEAVVVRLETAARSGFGMMFVNVDVERAEALDRYLASKGYPTHDERRAHPRFELIAQVQVTRESECHVMATVNVSRGGLFLQGDPPEYPDLSVGAEVELLISDVDEPDGEVIQLEAVVVRTEPGAGGGFAVKFVNLDIATAEQLDRYLTSKGIPVPEKQGSRSSLRS